MSAAILRTAGIRAACPALHACAAVGSCAPVLRSGTRGFARSAPRFNSLVAPAPNEQATKGGEGLHRSTFPTFDLHNRWPILVLDSKVPTAPSSPLTKQDGASTVPQPIHGDWVLFHPVYSENEVKAVQGMLPALTCTTY